MTGKEALNKIEKYVKYNEIEKYNNKKLFKKIDKGCEDKNDFFYCHYIIYSELQKLEKLEKIIKEIKDTYDKNYDIAMAAWYKSIGLTKLLEVFDNE